MSDYILGIDAGASKTRGVLQQLQSSNRWLVTLGPGNITNDLREACSNIKEVVTRLLVKASCLAEKTTLVCGVAGATNETARKSLESSLEVMNFKHLLITSDAQTSLYGAGRGDAMIVVAIGTGSVAMRLDNDGVEKQFGGWGFVAGDHGSGAYIGRELVASVLKLFDQDDFIADPLSSDVLTIIGNDQQTIAIWLQAATPAKFAELAPLVTRAIDQSALARTVLEKAAAEIEQLISRAQGTNSLSVCLIGGLADSIKPLLSTKLQQQLINAKGDAVEGAIYLAQRLLNSDRQQKLDTHPSHNRG